MELLPIPQQIHAQALEVVDAWRAARNVKEEDPPSSSEVVLRLHGTPTAELYVEERPVFSMDAPASFVDPALRLIAQGVAQSKDDKARDVYELAGAAHRDGRAELTMVVNLSFPQIALILVPAGAPIQQGVIMWRLAVPTPATMH